MEEVKYPKVIKRDGREVVFNEEKIKQAITAAMKKTEAGVDSDLINRIVTNLKNSKMFKEEKIEVEQIQDFIENELMKSSRKEVAKEYILYREERSKIRRYKSKLMKAVASKLNAKDIVNQNANVDENSFGGRVGEATSVVMKEIALNNLYSKKSRDNHINNEIYIHDLDSLYSHNCLQVPIDKLLAEGFTTRQTDIRPAGSINTAFQLVAVIFQIQSLQQFGGVSSGHLDHTMVPYVRKSFYKHYLTGVEFLTDEDNVKVGKEVNNKMSIEDEAYKSRPKVYEYALKLTTQELTQAVEGLFHNLNSLQSRSGRFDCRLKEIFK